jgi:hypothetical protein
MGDELCCECSHGLLFVAKKRIPLSDSQLSPICIDNLLMESLSDWVLTGAASIYLYLNSLVTQHKQRFGFKLSPNENRQIENIYIPDKETSNRRTVKVNLSACNFSCFTGFRKDVAVSLMVVL